MSQTDRSRRSPIRLVVLAVIAITGTGALIVAVWLAWSLFGPEPEGFAPTAGAAPTLTDTGQVRQFTVDARSRKEWVYFDFSTGRVADAARTSLDWDLAFRRTDILTNGGETNPSGAGGAADLGKVELLAASPPGEGFVTDVTHDERGLENPALHKWYRYNWTTHDVTARSQVFAVRTADGDVALLKFLSYYCDDGSPGCVTFRFTLPGDRAPDDATGRLSQPR